MVCRAMPSQAQPSAQIELLAIHVIHKSHNAGMQRLLAYIVTRQRAYASEIAGNGLNMWDTCGAQDFGRIAVQQSTAGRYTLALG